MLDDDEARRLLAAARHTEQHAHLEGGTLLVEDLARQAGIRCDSVARSANTRGVSSFGALASVRA